MGDLKKSEEHYDKALKKCEMNKLNTKQNQQDFEVFCKAVKNGKLPVASRKLAL